MKTISQVAWPFQERAISAVLEKLCQTATILVAPTGAGKTFMSTRIAEQYSRVLFVAHRIELVKQARAAGLWAMTVAQALKTKRRGVNLLIIDECHRAMAATYRALVRRFKGVPLLGLTATPLRTDGQGLCDVFGQMVVAAQTRELIDSGHLVPYRAFEADIDALKQLAWMKKRGGDFAQGDLSKLMNQPRLVGDVVTNYLKNGEGRKAICFAVSVEHSKALADAFVAAGVRAEHLDGRASAKNRDAALARVVSGETQVLCNVNLFTEGWDCPDISCVIMARPTASLTLYLQSVGRGMRIALGKIDLLLFDHAGNIERHGLPDAPREWSLESDKQREKHAKALAGAQERGFESVEAELKETLRQKEITCGPSYAVSSLGIAARELVRQLRRAGILPHGTGRLSATRYLKSEIDSLSQKMRATYPSKQALGLLGVSTMTAARIAGIKAVGHWRGAASRYNKSEIDNLVVKLRAARESGLSTVQVAALLGIGTRSVGKTLARYNVGPQSIGFRRPLLYRPEDIERVAAERQIV